MVNQNRCRICLLVLLITAVTLPAFNAHQWALAQDGNWSTPAIISAPPGYSWFPDLAVDAFGAAHVVWCRTIPAATGGLEEQVYYSRWTQEGWTTPNDIVPPSADIVRNAIATDMAGNVHLLFGGSVYGGLSLYYQKALVDKAWSAAAWSPPQRVNQGSSYMGDIAVDSEGVIHVIYDDIVHGASGEEADRADIFYRRSTDGGETWSAPVDLHPEPLTGSARPFMKIDSNDVIHVTWDEGWDRLTGAMADEFYSVYRASFDGGQTWTEPKLIRYPDATVAQLTVGSDGKGGVMLVWRSMTRDQLFYQRSTDGGQTWQEPSVIPQILARSWTIPFDMYDMATDSNGHIHLLVTGRLSNEKQAPVGIYHLVWDGESWAAPTMVFAQPGLYPEYPKIVVHEGNQLHAAWFTREGSEFRQDVNRLVWYSRRQISAPHQPATPWPTATPEPTRSLALTPSPSPTPTSYLPFSHEWSDLPKGLNTESDALLQLATTLIPVVIVIGVLAAVQMRRSGKL